MSRSILNNRIVKNAGWLIFGKVFQMLINFFVGILSARYLGPSNYGLISYAAAYTAFFTAFCTLGINSIIVKEFIDRKGQEGEILGTAIGLRAISSILSAIMIIAISLIVDKDEPITVAVVALSSLGAVFHIFEVFNHWFQSKLESKKTAIASLIAYSVAAVYKIVLLASGSSVVYFALVSSVDYICVAIILFLFYKKDHGGKFSFSWEYGKVMLKKSCHFILPGLMIAVYGQTDRIMLKHMISEAEIGYYALAVSLCGIWTFILSAIIDSLVPSIMKAHKEDYQKFKQLNRLLYCVIFYVSAIVSVLFMLLGRTAIYFLYGEAYLPAAAPLSIITWYTAFSYFGVARNAWIVCENKQRYLKYIYFSAAISNVVLNLIFIPPLGASGAAIASLAAQIITTMVAPFFIKEMRENSIMMVEAILFKGIKRS